MGTDWLLTTSRSRDWSRVGVGIVCCPRRGIKRSNRWYHKSKINPTAASLEKRSNKIVQPKKEFKIVRA